MVDFKAIGEKWQKEWDKEKIFHSEAEEGKKKYYVAIVIPI